MLITDLINLLPDDAPKIFYEKMIRLSESRLRDEILKFEHYEYYARLLRFQEALLNQPDANIRIVYNDKNGIHLSSCDKSICKIILPDQAEGKILCTCDEDLKDPTKFFWKMHRDMLFRCRLCKRYSPDWEDITPLERSDKEELDK